MEWRRTVPPKEFLIALGTYRAHSRDSNDHSSLEVAVSLAANSPAPIRHGVA